MCFIFAILIASAWTAGKDRRKTGLGEVVVFGEREASRTAALPNYTPKNADSLWSTRNLMGVHKVSLQISSKLFLNKLVCVFLLMHILCAFFLMY